MKLLLLSVTFFSTLSLAQPAPKVSVCHRSGDGFHVINISSNALPAHLRHGDVLAPVEGATVDVTLGDGTVVTLDATCAIVAG